MLKSYAIDFKTQKNSRDKRFFDVTPAVNPTDLKKRPINSLRPATPLPRRWFYKKRLGHKRQALVHLIATNPIYCDKGLGVNVDNGENARYMKDGSNNDETHANLQQVSQTAP